MVGLTALFLDNIEDGGVFSVYIIEGISSELNSLTASTLLPFHERSMDLESESGTINTMIRDVTRHTAMPTRASIGTGISGSKGLSVREEVKASGYFAAMEEGPWKKEADRSVRMHGFE